MQAPRIRGKIGKPYITDRTAREDTGKQEQASKQNLQLGCRCLRKAARPGLLLLASCPPACWPGKSHPRRGSRHSHLSTYFQNHGASNTKRKKYKNTKCIAWKLSFFSSFCFHGFSQHFLTERLVGTFWHSNKQLSQRPSALVLVLEPHLPAQAPCHKKCVSHTWKHKKRSARKFKLWRSPTRRPNIHKAFVFDLSFMTGRRNILKYQVSANQPSAAYMSLFESACSVC